MFTSGFKLCAMAITASRRPLVTEARCSIPVQSLRDIWPTVRH